MSLLTNSENPEGTGQKNAGINGHPAFEKDNIKESEFINTTSFDTQDEEEKKEKPVTLPNLPESIYAGLPEFLKRAVSTAETNEERDILLLCSLTVLGACMPNVHGFYDMIKVYPNLYLFVTAPASAGKGRLKFCQLLVEPVDLALRKESQQLKKEYEKKMNEYLRKKKTNPDIDLPKLPPQKMLFIPANSSSTGVFQLLSDNEGKGIIFEMEGDTLTLAFKSKHGNFSDGYRKAFHHESISYYRKTNREYVYIESPRMSSVLSGTFDQIASLIPDAANGLFSRFIFYFMNWNMAWKDVFSPKKRKGLDEHFTQLGDEYYQLYEALNKNETIEFRFTKSQIEIFNQFFSQIQVKYIAFHGLDYVATVRRLGLIAFRIAMILNTLRILETGNFSRKQECRDVDFYACLNMIKVLISHASFVFTNLHKNTRRNKKVNRKELFLESLPKEFNHREYISIAEGLRIKERSADGYMVSFCEHNLVTKLQRDKYIKN